MKKFASIAVFICFYLISPAQAMDAKDSLKNDIRNYVSMLNHHVNEIEETENIDSIKNYAADIHENINAFFQDIRKVYRSDQKDREGGANLGIATALNEIAPGSGTYFQVKGINKLLHHTDNDKYFKRLDRVRSAAKKLQVNNNVRKINKLKEKLAEKVVDLNKIPLK